jgi:hypothetical protein
LLASLLVATAGSAENGRARRVDGARAARLHALADDLLPARKRSSQREEARALRSALDALSTSLSETESRPTKTRLDALRSGRRRAEAALGELQRRISRGGTSPNADELGRLFAPLWADIDEALSGPSGGRARKLAEARRRLEQARSQATNVHSTSFVSQPLLEGR